MKIVFIIIVVLLLALQFQLWFGRDGLKHTIQLRRAVAVQENANQKLYKRNQKIAKEIVILKKGPGMAEDLAREQMGMVKPDEKYYQFVDSEENGK